MDILRGEPALKASKKAIFFSFYKSLVKHLKNIFLKFKSEIRSPFHAMRT